MSWFACSWWSDRWWSSRTDWSRRGRENEEWKTEDEMSSRGIDLQRKCPKHRLIRDFVHLSEWGMVCRRTLHTDHWWTSGRKSRGWDDEQCEVVSTLAHARRVSYKDVRWEWEMSTKKPFEWTRKASKLNGNHSNRCWSISVRLNQPAIHRHSSGTVSFSWNRWEASSFADSLKTFWPCWEFIWLHPSTLPNVNEDTVQRTECKQSIARKSRSKPTVASWLFGFSAATVFEGETNCHRDKSPFDQSSAKIGHFFFDVWCHQVVEEAFRSWNDPEANRRLNRVQLLTQEPLEWYPRWLWAASTNPTQWDEAERGKRLCSDWCRWSDRAKKGESNRY